MFSIKRWITKVHVNLQSSVSRPFLKRYDHGIESIYRCFIVFLFGRHHFFSGGIFFSGYVVRDFCRLDFLQDVFVRFRLVQEFFPVSLFSDYIFVQVLFSSAVCSGFISFEGHFFSFVFSGLFFLECFRGFTFFFGFICFRFHFL